MDPTPAAHHAAHPGPPVQEAVWRGEPMAGQVFTEAPRNVYWETTIACDLACRHCRAGAIPDRHPGELTTAEAAGMMRDVKAMGSMLILTGGDPMKRPDLFELIEEARAMHLPLSITPSTTPALREADVERFRALGVAALGLSLDGPTPEVHDAFRGVPGTFACSERALAWARTWHLPVQVNTTVTRETLPHLPALYGYLRGEATPPVRRWSLFLVVPVGRGAQLAAPTAAEVERLFDWIYRTAGEAPFHVSTVEAPHYRRFWIERKLAEGVPVEEIRRMGRRMGFGVRDGNGVIFVSHLGDVFPAGFLPHPLLGNIRRQQLSEIYRRSPDLAALRDMDALDGPCGRCACRWVCGGSRARAWAVTGDLMGSDPLCALAAGESGMARDWSGTCGASDHL